MLTSRWHKPPIFNKCPEAYKQILSLKVLKNYLTVVLGVYFSCHHSLPTLITYNCLHVHICPTCCINYTSVSIWSSRGHCVVWHACVCVCVCVCVYIYIYILIKLYLFLSSILTPDTIIYLSIIWTHNRRNFHCSMEILLIKCMTCMYWKKELNAGKANRYFQQKCNGVKRQLKPHCQRGRPS